MAYKYVTVDQLTRAAGRLRQQGASGDQLKIRLKSVANEMEYLGSKASAMPMLFKAAIPAFITSPAEHLRGITPFTPGDTLIDELFREGARKLEASTSPGRQREVSEALQGPMWGKGMGRTWQAIVGSNLPIMADAAIARALGMIGGKAIGGAIGGAVALAGGAAIPGPEEIATVPAGALIGQGIGGKVGALTAVTGVMTTREASGFLKATEDFIDRDISEKWARRFGPMSGIVESAQQLYMLTPFLKRSPLGRKVIKKAVPLRAFTRTLKGLGLESLGNIVEGLTEVTQGALFNRALDEAVREQDERNAERGLGPINPADVARLKSELGRDFGAGLGLSMIMRTTGRTLRGTVRVGQFGAAVAKEVKGGKVKGVKLFQAIKSGKSLEALFGTKPNAISTEPYGSVQAWKEALTSTDIVKQINDLPATSSTIGVSTVNGVAKAWGVGLTGPNRSTEQVRQELRQLAETEEEGPLIRQRPFVRAPVSGYKWGGKTYKKGQVLKQSVVDIVPVKLNPVHPTIAKTGMTVDRLLRSTIKGLSSNVATWFESMQVALRIRDKNMLNEAQDAGKALGLSDEEIKAARLNIEVNPANPEPIPDRDIFIDEAERKRILSETRRKALATVTGEEISNALISDGPDLTKSSGLAVVLTQSQYTQYVTNLEGELRNSIRVLHGKLAVAKLDVAVAKAMAFKPIPLHDGGVINVTQLPTKEGEVSSLRRLSAQMPALESLERHTGIRFVGMQQTIREGQVLEQNVIEGVNLAVNSYWSKVPRALRRGAVGKRLAEFATWLGVNANEKAGLVKQLGVMGNNKAGWAAYIKAVGDKSVKSLSKEEIIKQAEWVKKNDDVMYGWWRANGAVDPKQFINKYRPIIRMYNDSGMTMPFDEWIRTQREKNALVRNLQKGETEDLVDLIDSFGGWKQKGIPVVGKSKPFFQFSREIDREAVRDIARIPNSRVLLDWYTRKAARKIIFGDMAPAVSHIINQANKVKGLTQEQRKTINVVMTNYLETIMGVPDAATKVLQRVNLATPLNSFRTMSNKLVKKLNDTKLFGRIFPLKEKPDDLRFTAAEALQLGVTARYVLDLGIPFNLVLPVKNLATQNVMASVAVGMNTYLEGLNRLVNDPDMVKQLITYNLRPEMAMYEWGDLNVQGKFSLITKASMAVFRASDLSNVFGSASAGIVAWERLEPVIKQKGNTDVLVEDVVSALIKGKPDSRIKDSAVMKRKAKGSDIWNGVISKPLVMEITERIKAGKVEDAKRLWLQYLVNFSQWRYGPGGTPGILRNAIMRSLFMYTSWGINNLDYLKSTLWRGLAHPKSQSVLLSRYIQMYSSRWLILSVLALLGYKSYRWGGLLDSIDPSGAYADLINNVLALITGAGESFAAETMPGVPQEEREAIRRHVQRQWDDLFD